MWGYAIFRQRRKPRIAPGPLLWCYRRPAATDQQWSIAPDLSKANSTYFTKQAIKQAIGRLRDSTGDEVRRNHSQHETRDHAAAVRLRCRNEPPAGVSWLGGCPSE